MGRVLLLPALLLLACASSQQPANQPAVQFRATNGPTVVPKPISAPPDVDNDRVPDYRDSCPDQPGSLRDGCPYTDTDRDGISDKNDKCPLVPEPRQGHADKDGCPIVPIPTPPPATTPPVGAPPTGTPPPPASTPPVAAPPATPPPG